MARPVYSLGVATRENPAMPVGNNQGGIIPRRDCSVPAGWPRPVSTLGVPRARRTTTTGKLHRKCLHLSRNAVYNARRKTVGVIETP